MAFLFIYTLTGNRYTPPYIPYIDFFCGELKSYKIIFELVKALLNFRYIDFKILTVTHYVF